MGDSDGVLLAGDGTRAITASNATGTVGRATGSLFEGGLETELAVAEGDVDHTLMDKERNGGESSSLLATAEGSGGAVDGGHLAAKGAGSPETAGCNTMGI